ncbi:nucleoside triphosphate pyrophosphohydrolase [Ginsengibacter hankyongi]|uniref:Nucleoside triphosphate pyrophosphohydrolase n=1 Tax=Ginsengibacter hankyongi TaxID=2607284 RepID=A0A5J5IMF5_9BACT|nr:nucleoside triphosphate pyrophosphohydrolase [Ginsengibacter hankyongi]KAA9041064.1 nucleoside triphosphate pyrophosphohydrolase [Ginsengibacter hankyongi]
MPEINSGIERLVNMMNELREKCPWDKKQTIHILRQQTIEETFELADAITDKDWKGIKEELGDLLLHIIFYAKIADEEKQFSLQGVIDDICEKLIKRHPHIYGTVTVKDDEEVKRNWEQIKLSEGKKSVLSGVPKSLPAMVKAMRLQEKAKQVGFEWETKEQVWEKIEEEKNELLEAVNEGDSAHIEEEAGDLFFSVINYVRFVNVDAENALEITNKKFIQRFTKMEETAAKSGHNLSNMTLKEMDEMWNEIKKQKL